SGALDDVEVANVRPFEKALLAYLNSNNKELMAGIEEKKDLTDDLKKQLDAAVKQFKSGSTY
ncbi:F0F1 ATP synthase subunit alpha, partial [Acidithiobacillus ferrooxidans]|nr:F0F1 ATP synthase subunit alpha [Acidithiobacillus ferrooxidans]